MLTDEAAFSAAQRAAMVALGESCGWSMGNLTRGDRVAFCTQHGITAVRSAARVCTLADGQQRGQRHPCGGACVGMQSAAVAMPGCVRVRSNACLLGQWIYQGLHLTFKCCIVNIK